MHTHGTRNERYYRENDIFYDLVAIFNEMVAK